MTRFALKGSPKGRVELDRAAKSPNDWGFKYYEEQFNVFQRLGATRYEYERIKPGVRRSTAAPYDVRVLTSEAEKVIDDIEAEIVRLQQERKRYVEEHFLEWPIATKDDVPIVVPSNMTEVEAKARVKARGARSKAEAVSETKAVKAINRSLGKMFNLGS